MLVSENVHRDDTNWLAQEAVIQYPSTDPARTQQALSIGWVYDSGNPLQPSSNLFVPIGQDDANGNYASYGSAYMRPSSQHSTIFIAAFCDGSTRKIDNSIEYRVYQQLMTTDGLNAAVVGNPNTFIEKPTKTFMTTPLSDGEY
ncbi:MAG: DUF1559 domain-containing protein [Planctomycetales bacterium]|nr:DUF1559 domain-containing protein [Planctomycetales bacterium]